MRRAILLSVVACGSAAQAFALPSPLVLPSIPSVAPQIRARQSHAVSLLATAYRRSETIRRLVQAISLTDVIVYIELSLDRSVPRGRTILAGGTPGHRTVVVTINTAHPPNMLIALVGHELQHVLEIAQEPGVIDSAGMRDLYRRIGLDRSAKDRFETSEAQDTERRVWADIGRGKV